MKIVVTVLSAGVVSLHTHSSVYLRPFIAITPLTLLWSLGQNDSMSRLPPLLLDLHDVLRIDPPRLT
jgi:hypothetical protein